MKCSNYMRWMPEPKIGLALARLYQGDPKTAYSLIQQQLQFILDSYGAADPNPVQWAYHIVALLCLGNVEGAVAAGRRYGWLVHPELERVRWVLSAISAQGSVGDAASSWKQRRTLHRLPVRSDARWWPTSVTC